MNHNFADWEITQLLPEKNPFYCKQDEEFNEFQFHWFQNFESKNIYISGENALYVHECGERYKFLRNSWSWEDIRLYLESKKISFVVWEYYIDNKTKYGFISWSKNNLLFPQYSSCNNDDITFDSYEEAREEAVKYCLTKIKNG